MTIEYFLYKCRSCMTYIWDEMSLTFDCDLSRGVDHSQGGYRHTGVVSRLPDVGELQHISANGHLLLFGEFLFALHPLHIGHWSAHGHAGEVHAAARHHLVIGRRDWETRRNSPDCWRSADDVISRTQIQEGREYVSGMALAIHQWHLGSVFEWVDCKYKRYEI